MLLREMRCMHTRILEFLGNDGPQYGFPREVPSKEDVLDQEDFATKHSTQ